jgi:hypothetical protein
MEAAGLTYASWMQRANQPVMTPERQRVELGEGAMQCWVAAQLARRRPGGVYSRHSEPPDSESRLQVVAAADNERSRLPFSEPAHTWYPATPAY